MNGMVRVVVMSLAMALVSIQTFAADIGTAFTYQGFLENGSPPAPVDDTCDFRFQMYDAAAGGNLKGTNPQDKAGVAVNAGVFTVNDLDFGSGAIDGTARWLEISVCCPSPCAVVPLSPRVELTPTPHAIRASEGVGPPNALEVDQATGNVGIGTTSPARKLDVTGVVRSSTGGFEFPDGTLLSSAAGISPLLSLAQIATLRWDFQQADFVVGTFPVGNDALFVAFDGANVWVTRRFNNTVTKLRASDGVNLGIFAVGTQPHAVAFDGANIWTANYISNNVTKLRATDGANLGAFPVGNGPNGMAFDGANIWVVNLNSNNVTKLRALDGVNLGTFPVGGYATGVAFDGANIWVLNGFGPANVTKLRASDGANLGTFAVGNGARGIAFDGSSIWVANSFSNDVTKLRASDGANLGTFAAGTGAVGIAFDGANMWVTNIDSDTVTKLRASDGFNLGTFPAGDGPTGVAFDGANIWVANNLSGDVAKIFVSDDVGLSQWQRIVGGIAYTAGRVGIGRNSAANALEVEGDASKTVAGDWLANSDRRIKTRIRTITNALDAILRVRPVAFRYTDEYKAKHPSIQDRDYYNYVAQEFREVFPECVQHSGEDGLLQMDSYPASVYSVAAIQELYEMVQEKDCEMEELRSQIEGLKELVKALAAQNQNRDSHGADTNGGGR